MARALILAPRRRSRVSRLVKGSYAEDQWAVAVIQVLEQQQDAGYLTGRPHRPIEHLMVAGVVLVVAQSHDPQGRDDGALTRGQDRAHQQHLGFAFRQVGLVNSVAKGTRTATMASGRVSMAGPLVRFGSGQLTLSLYFF